MLKLAARLEVAKVLADQRILLVEQRLPVHQSLVVGGAEHPDEALLRLGQLDEPADVAGHEVDEHLDRLHLQQWLDRVHRETGPAGRIDEHKRKVSLTAGFDEGNDRGYVVFKLALNRLHCCIGDRICECLQLCIRALLLLDEEAAELDCSAVFRVGLTSLAELIECDRE